MGKLFFAFKTLQASLVERWAVELCWQGKGEIRTLDLAWKKRFCQANSAFNGREVAVSAVSTTVVDDVCFVGKFSDASMVVARMLIY